MENIKLIKQINKWIDGVKDIPPSFGEKYKVGYAFALEVVKQFLEENIN